MTDQRASAPRSIVELDVATGTVRMGEAEQRVRDLSDPEQLYPAYLSLLYAVRGARRGEEIPLRSADIEALLQVIGDDPEYIERKLVELMGCTAEEASLLRRVLLRHRALTAGVGVAAGLSLVALLGPASAGATPAPAPAPVASITPADPSELPPLPSYATTDTGEHVPVPESWGAEAEVAPASAAPAGPADVTTATATTTTTTTTATVAPSASPSVAPSATPSPSPSASPTPTVTASASPSVAPSAATSPAVAPATAPAPAAESEVVLGPPMAPIDRPAPDSEVVLGEPTAPIDRPGWSPEQEVVLGEPRAPIDRAPAGDPNEVALGEAMTPIDRVGTDVAPAAPDAG